MVDQESPSTARPVRTAIMAITLGAALISLISLAAILIEYFAKVSVWPPLMAVGLWGLPLAFIGLVSLLVIAVRDRSRTEPTA